MPIYQTLDELTVDYFTTHPEEVDEFVTEIFAEYAQDWDSAALLSALRSIARAKGISTIAEETSVSRQKMGETAVAESRADYKLE